MKLPRIKIGRPQRLAALLLLFFLAECLWVVSHQQLSQQDYRYAECGREMWERPSPLAGYFTTCGNLNGDGTFAYRVAGLPLTVQRLAMLGADKLRSPENRLYAQGTLHGSTWEARHELFSVKYLLHLPFIFFAIWLGGGLWWVSRRLFGNEGGFFALGLYCFCPGGRAVCGYAEQRCAGDVGALRTGVHGDGCGSRDAGSAREVEAAHRVDDGSTGVDGSGASAGGDARLCDGDGVDDVSGRAPAQLRDADPGLLRSRRAGNPVCVLCVPARAVQLCLYRWRRAVLVCVGRGSAASF